MKPNRSRRRGQQQIKQRTRSSRRPRSQPARPAAAYRERGFGGNGQHDAFGAPETWHEPQARSRILFKTAPPGDGYIHPVGVEEIRSRLARLPCRFTRNIEVVQLSRMTRKRALFPCYGMQWGPNIYLYPIEESLLETYLRPPLPQQEIEARMYGGQWYQDGDLWRLQWTREAIRDFYLNNVLIHEVGHVNDNRNSNPQARERYANWFAVEYGFRASRGRR